MKAGGLQRNISLLWFSLSHVILTLHTHRSTRWQLTGNFATSHALFDKFSALSVYVSKSNEKSLKRK